MSHRRTAYRLFACHDAYKELFRHAQSLFRIPADPAEHTHRHSREGDRVVSIYNNSSWRDGYPPDAQGGELVDCQIQPPAGEEKVYEARCLRRSEAVVCHTILVAAYPFS